MQCHTLSVKEVARYLGVHTDTIYTMVKLKQIPHVKLRNRILFTQETIDEWMQGQARENIDN
ncbi:helix-turn-helix domain-containing protein [Lentibacillus sp. Marseille-P4043]|uniref:helix-turn-helix domain-containing protein n=1 Tax=Lentibacillus sp. Marseille-P4043 TaxID=2040293 RepID=UPI000D0B3AFE|nr:helix-turn-helix domain-containing protein [Lentibacillus sp. Marseille-P4043]